MTELYVRLCRQDNAYFNEKYRSEQTGRHPVWGINAPFRDLPGVRQNGYAMPVRYPGQPAEQAAQPWRGGGQRLGGVPGAFVKPDPDVVQQLVKPDPDGVYGEWKYFINREPTALRSDMRIEPAIFKASSLLHFNDTHRSPGVQNAKQSRGSSPSKAARAPASASSSRKTSADSSAPLGSSSGRVVNTANSLARQSPVATMRNYFGQRDGGNSASLNVSSKAKGKAKAIGPYPATKPAQAMLGSASRTFARPLGSPANGARVKREQVESPSVKTERIEPSLCRPRRSSSPEEPPIGLTQRVPPSRVKTEKAENMLIKSERTEVTLSAGRLMPVKAALGSLARPPGSSTRPGSSVVRVQTISVKPSPTPSPFSSGHSLGPLSYASSSSSSPTGPPEIIDVDALDDDPPARPAAVKRRLGMGRATGGYANKKFKPLMPGDP